MSSGEFLWCEEYRPKKIDDCILPDELKTTFKQVVDTGEVPNMLLSGTSGLGTGLFGASVSKALGYIGTALLFGGVSQLLSPSPPSFNEASKLQSFSFSGIVNVADQGLPVPICYGRVITGSVVISAGLNSEPLIVSGE